MRITDFEFESFEAQIPRGVANSDHGEVVFYVPSRPAAVRFETLFSKEPETIAWIADFETGGIFVDVGANVGMYTIWAAKHRNMRVHAFEPEAQNFATLNQNIRLNNLGQQVIAYGAAISDEAKFSVLNLGDLRIGGAFNSFDEPVGHDLKPREPLFRQGAISTTLDGLVSDGTLPLPNHIKIDVDGFEHKVVQGARQTLSAPEVKSVMIELNPELEIHMDLVTVFRDLGFEEPPQFAERFEARGGGNCLFRRSGS